MRSACLLAAVLLTMPSAQGQAPVYQRMRTGASHLNGRPGYHHDRPAGVDAYGLGASYGAYFAPPLVVGSYYQRPYPYHFDYYRNRWGGGPREPSPLQSPQVEMMPVTECPCLAGTSSGEDRSPTE